MRLHPRLEGIATVVREAHSRFEAHSDALAHGTPPCLVAGESCNPHPLHFRGWRPCKQGPSPSLFECGHQDHRCDCPAPSDRRFGLGLSLDEAVAEKRALVRHSPQQARLLACLSSVSGMPASQWTRAPTGSLYWTFYSGWKQTSCEVGQPLLRWPRRPPWDGRNTAPFLCRTFPDVSSSAAPLFEPRLRESARTCCLMAAAATHAPASFYLACRHWARRCSPGSAAAPASSSRPPTASTWIPRKPSSSGGNYPISASALQSPPPPPLSVPRPMP
mmetsp:Transcript_103482/g.179672  ORF Transcript_103482/g.179672 Transcript_103482/m.179672 type:complete len:275 (+) Transcript_103482:780-1604(+)